MFTVVAPVRVCLLSGAAAVSLFSIPALAQSASETTRPAPSNSTTPGDQAASVANQAIATSPAGGDIGAIIVTARRRAESLKDVPVAVTAYTGAQLQKSGAIDITDLAQTTPNVTLKPSRGTNSTLSAFIRGEF